MCTYICKRWPCSFWKETLIFFLFRSIWITTSKIELILGQGSSSENWEHVLRWFYALTRTSARVVNPEEKNKLMPLATGAGRLDDSQLPREEGRDRVPASRGDPSRVRACVLASPLPSSLARQLRVLVLVLATHRIQFHSSHFFYSLIYAICSKINLFKSLYI